MESNYNYYNSQCYSPANNTTGYYYNYMPQQQYATQSNTNYGYYNQYQYNSSISSSTSPSSVSSVSSEYLSPCNFQETNNYTMPVRNFSSPAPNYPAYQETCTPFRENTQFSNPTSTPYQETVNFQPAVDTTTQPKKSNKRPHVIKIDLAQASMGFGVVHSKTKVASSTNDIVSASNPIKCTMCNQSFVSLAKLFMHQHKYHKKGSSLQCPICYKKFNTQANALVHLRAHTQEKSYGCHMCSQAFCDSSTLKKHVRTHTGEKPYECHICEKKFTQSGNLKRHLAVHEKYDAIQAKNKKSSENDEVPNTCLESENVSTALLTEFKTQFVRNEDLNQKAGNLSYADYTGAFNACSQNLFSSDYGYYGC